MISIIEYGASRVTLTIESEKKATHNEICMSGFQMQGLTLMILFKQTN